MAARATRGGAGDARLRNASSCLAEHWSRHLHAEARSSRKRRHAGPVAVCVLGQMRLFGLAAYNQRWALGLDAVAHHLFFIGPADRSWRAHERFVARLPNSTSFRYAEDVLAFDEGHEQPLWRLGWVEASADRPPARPTLMLNTAHAGAFGLLTPGGLGVQRRFVNLMVQLVQQTQCAQMVRAHEARTGTRFARVVKARADVYLYTRPPSAALRPRQLLWPSYKGGAQDVFFDAPAPLALAMLDSAPLLLPATTAPPRASLGLIHELWRERLRLYERDHRVELVETCAPASSARAGGAAWCFVGWLRGAPSCRAFGFGLESPDPEDYPFAPDAAAPPFSEVPRRVRAAMYAAARECFDASASRAPLAGCAGEVQGDPGQLAPLAQASRSRPRYRSVPRFQKLIK